MFRPINYRPAHMCTHVLALELAFSKDFTVTKICIFESNRRVQIFCFQVSKKEMLDVSDVSYISCVLH